MKKINVIIPAAGMATRMRPLSNSTSKAMIAVNGKPIIAYIIEKLLSNKQVESITIVQNKSKDIEEFVNIVYSDEVKLNLINFVVQKDPKGPLHAIEVGSIETRTNDNGVLVWLGDTICDDTFEFNNENFVVTHKVDDYQRWCLVDKNGNYFDKPKEKPPTDQALIGIYYFAHTSVFLERIKEAMAAPLLSGEHQIASLLNLYVMKPIESDEWFDCGDLKSFHESRGKLIQKSSRSFNKLEVNTFLNVITKSADDISKREKIKMEKNWFLSLNETQKLFCPNILDSKDGTLSMSWESGTPLNEMWLYENINAESWTDIYRKIIKIFHEVFYIDRTGAPDDAPLNCFTVYVHDSLNRISNYKHYPDYEMVYYFIKKIGTDLIGSCEKNWVNLIHGDPHMGNILFDSLNGSIKFVDPRGHFGNGGSLGGDRRYDMAKILQDLYCGYPQILSKRYLVSYSGVDILWKNESYRDTILSNLLNIFKEYGYNVDELQKIAILLIFTCIPFHSEDPNRQLAFWMRGLDLIKGVSF